MKEKIFALAYDFDKTLSPQDMQNYGFIPGINMEAENFWSLCTRTVKANQMDMILGYMLVMLKEAEGKMLLTKDVFRKMGEKVSVFPGVSTWFQRINDHGLKKGVTVQHYIISSGLKEIIEGTKIAKEFKKIFAAEFVYNERGVPVWPAMAVNYTSKTQFLFRINKGELDVTNHDGINEFIKEEERPVPFKNMVYIGDGMTDIPCFKIVKSQGGHSIAVYGEDDTLAKKMLSQERVDFVFKADYGKGKPLEKKIMEIIDKIGEK